MAWIYVSTKVDTYQEQVMSPGQIAEICRRRGGSGCGGVRGMVAAAGPPPPPPPPPHPAIPRDVRF
jgi:hypothetical protein